MLLELGQMHTAVSCFYNLGAEASQALQDFALGGFCLVAETVIWWSGMEVERTKSWEQGGTVESQLKENRSGTRVRSDPQQKDQKWKSLNICHRNEHAV